MRHREMTNKYKYTHPEKGAQNAENKDITRQKTAAEKRVSKG